MYDRMYIFIFIHVCVEMYSKHCIVLCNLNFYSPVYDATDSVLVECRCFPIIVEFC